MSFSDDSWTFQKHAHVPTRSPDAAVLTAHSGILAGGVHTHVVQGGLAHHVVGTPELGSSFSLWNKQKTVFSVYLFIYLKGSQLSGYSWYQLKPVDLIYNMHHNICVSSCWSLVHLESFYLKAWSMNSGKFFLGELVSRLSKLNSSRNKKKTLYMTDRRPSISCWAMESFF